MSEILWAPYTKFLPIDLQVVWEILSGFQAKLFNTVSISIRNYFCVINIDITEILP